MVVVAAAVGWRIERERRGEEMTMLRLGAARAYLLIVSGAVDALVLIAGAFFAGGDSYLPREVFVTNSGVWFR